MSWVGSRRPNPPAPSAGPNRPSRPNRNPLVLVGLGLFATFSALLVLALVVRYVGTMLPTGSRASIPSVAPSDEQRDLGRYWYSDAEAQALSAELATAVEGTDWCVGWAVIIYEPGSFSSSSYDPGLGSDDFGSDGPGLDDFDSDLDSDLDGGIDVPDYSSASPDERADVGSSRGVDVSARTCPQWVEIEVVYHYTSASSELEDNADFSVASSDGDVYDAFASHPAYDISSADLLHEDRGETRDDVIGNAVAGMPLVLAEAGELDPLSVEPVEEGSEGAVSFADREGEGGSDLWRGRGTWLLAGGLVVALGVTLALMAWAQVPTRFFGADLARGADGRPVNPRRALKAALQRARIEEEQGGPGRTHR